MRLNVFFTPAEILRTEAQPGDISIVIDVIRATTTLAVLFDRGVKRVLVAGSIESAREAAQKVPGRYLCGERNVRPLPGFDYGNSPSQFARLDLSNKEMILTTTNGTRAFYACPESTTRLAGSFYNAEAVVAYALQLAQERGTNIAIVCSGELDYFALDDATCAGYLALEVQRQYAATRQEQPLEVHESVSAATAIYETYKPPKIIDYCRSAQSVLQAGILEDPPFCMQISQSRSVPMVVGVDEQTGLLMLERADRATS